MGGKSFFSAPGDGRESRGAASPALPLLVTSDPEQSRSDERNGVGKYLSKSWSRPSGGTREFSARAEISFCCRGMFAGPGQVSISSDKAHHDTGENAPQFRLHFGGHDRSGRLGSVLRLPRSRLPHFCPAMTWRDQMAQTRTLPRQPQRVTPPLWAPGKPSPNSIPCATTCPVCGASSPALIPQGRFPLRRELSLFPLGHGALLGRARSRVAAGSGAGAGCGSRPLTLLEVPRSLLLLLPGGIPADPTAGGGGEHCPARPAARARLWERCAGAGGRGGDAPHPSPPRIAAGSRKSQALPYRTRRPRSPSRWTAAPPRGAPRGDALPAPAPPRSLRAPAKAAGAAPRARPRCPGRAVPAGSGGGAAPGAAAPLSAGSAASAALRPCLFMF